MVEQGDRIQVLRLLQDQRGISTKFDLDLSSLFPGHKIWGVSLTSSVKVKGSPEG